MAARNRHPAALLPAPLRPEPRREEAALHLHQRRPRLRPAQPAARCEITARPDHGSRPGASPREEEVRSHPSTGSGQGGQTEEEKLCRKRAQRTQGSPGSRVCENAAPAGRAPQQEEIHHQDTKAPRVCRFLRLVSWWLILRRSAGPARRFAACYAGAAFLCCRRDEKNKQA